MHHRTTAFGTAMPAGGKLTISRATFTAMMVMTAVHLSLTAAALLDMATPRLMRLVVTTTASRTITIHVRLVWSTITIGTTSLLTPILIFTTGIRTRSTTLIIITTCFGTRAGLVSIALHLWARPTLAAVAVSFRARSTTLVIITAGFGTRAWLIGFTTGFRCGRGHWLGGFLGRKRGDAEGAEAEQHQAGVGWCLHSLRGFADSSEKSGRSSGATAPLRCFVCLLKISSQPVGRKW